MEFYETLMKLANSKPDPNRKQSMRVSESDASSKTRRKWKISFTKSSSGLSPPSPPPEFVCFISGSLMADPVIVSSGHTFERACVESCKSLRFTPTLPDSTSPDFSRVITNLAIRDAILRWCLKSAEPPPKPLDSESAGAIVRKLIASQNTPPVNFKHAATPVTRRRSNNFFSNSGDMTPPIQLATRPICCSATSNSSETENEIQNPNCLVEEDIAAKLSSPLASVIENGVVLLRNVTRGRKSSRAHLCSARILTALRSLIVSRYSKIQVNSVAALVNLSLERVNKVKIVRSGLVLPLVDVLKGGFPKAQDHACGALFSLAVDDENKTAIGVLGAIEPLIGMMNSESKRGSHDSAMALYHLSLAQSNRSKLVKLGSVSEFLGIVKSGHKSDLVVPILCNLASCEEGRREMLDGGAVECLVGVLRKSESVSAASLENCVAALWWLSRAGMRFKALAEAAGLVAELRKVERVVSERAKEKAAKMVEVMEVKEEDEGLGGRNRHRGGGGGGLEWFAVNSSRF